MHKAEIIDGVVARVIAVDPENVPDDFVDWPEVGPKVGPGWTWVGVAFAPPAVNVAAVKAEAARRILALASEVDQRNAALRIGVLAMAARSRELTLAEEAEVAAIGEMLAGIEVIRAASDAIEAMDPIPADFADDKYWQKV